MTQRPSGKGLRVAVASGKGGTGKTLVSTNLAVAAGTWLADLDVEAPNCHLFPMTGQESVEGVFRPVPRITAQACDRCGECALVCRFGAILSLLDRVEVREEACHGCGACMELCPRGAVVMHERRTGDLVKLRGEGRGLVYGRMRVGEPSSVPLIRAVKSALPEGVGAVLDCPPGAGCGVAEALSGAGMCLLVTEPTRFGLHDLELALRLARKLRIPTAVLINKEGMEGLDMAAECARLGVEVVGGLPFDRSIAETYSKGRLLVEDAGQRDFFAGLWKRCGEVAGR